MTPTASPPRRLDPRTYDPGHPFVVPDDWDRPARDFWLERSVETGARWLAAQGVRPPPGDERTRMAWALASAQAAGYVPDPDHNRVEEFQPVAFTAQFGGDCEDLAALFRAHARLAGLVTRFNLIAFPDLDVDHMGSDGWLAGVWEPADASVMNARVGERPEAAAARTADADGRQLVQELAARATADVPRPPVVLARTQLRGGRCWRVALRTLQRAYDPETARRAWLALLLEPGSGWSREAPSSSSGGDNAATTRHVYCVPGYDALCGDVVGPEDDGVCGTDDHAAHPSGFVLPGPFDDWAILWALRHQNAARTRRSTWRARA